jgi:hypothetical protein
MFLYNVILEKIINYRIIKNLKSKHTLFIMAKEMNFVFYHRLQHTKNIITYKVIMNRIKKSQFYYK